MDIGLILGPLLFDKGTKYYSLINILLINLSILIDLFNLGTMHIDFGPLWGGGRGPESEKTC